MTKWGKLSIISAAALVAYLLIRTEWSIETVGTLLTGVLLGMVLAGAVVWWRLR